MQIEAKSDLKTLNDRSKDVNNMLATKRQEIDALIKGLDDLYKEANTLVAQCKRLKEAASEAMLEFLAGADLNQTIEDLEEEIDREKSKLECMHEGNHAVIEEFERRQKRIEALESKLEDYRHASAELQENIKEMRDQWEPALDRIVKQISESFSSNMKQIHCAGEVGVVKDGTEGNDFETWAIQIKVKFRYVAPTSSNSVLSRMLAISVVFQG